MKILMVEDDITLANIIKKYLLNKNIILDNITTGKTLLETLELSHEHELLILDLTLPDIDGLDLIYKIKKISKIPIIISSARDDILDKINGFDRGADDYLPKPYDPRELEARIKTVLKRYDIKSKEDTLFLIKDVEHIIYFQGEKLELTLAQYDILELLINRSPGVVTRTDIIYYSDNIDDDSSFKNIDVQISYIRKKLKLINDKEYIKSVRGLGYKLLK